MYEKAWKELMCCIDEIKVDAEEDEYSFRIALLCIDHIKSEILGESETDENEEVVVATA